jgi:2-iminobutanoate/2-iminopropanoate deaminase
MPKRKQSTTAVARTKPRHFRRLKIREPIDAHHSDGAPSAIGPYSQAVSVAGWLFTSGQIGLDPATGEMVAGGFVAQAHQVFANLRAVLKSSGCEFADVVKATVFITDFANFPTLNGIYAEAMGDHKPARSTVAAASLPKGALVEIDLVARIT